jgi:hypothetical protein
MTKPYFLPLTDGVLTGPTGKYVKVPKVYRKKQPFLL